ncbi:hypothetical protein I79_009004 [Cricetulus griseus]|uniref:Uncharacterized protein n=1 Tax=Cricetulus griseus TaxID=10029 RepID=G3HEL7_CRIGR|nr:hypothetical protein I79_009004 [Cricetulus griseus]
MDLGQPCDFPLAPPVGRTKHGGSRNLAWKNLQMLSENQGRIGLVLKRELKHRRMYNHGQYNLSKYQGKGIHAYENVFIEPHYFVC